MKTYIAALKANDAKAAAAHWEDAGVYVNTGIPTKRGRGEIEAMAQGAYDSARIDYAVTIDNIDAGTEMASLLGSYSAIVREPGTAPHRLGGRFLFVFRRQVDGSWKISRGVGTDPEPAK
jgi:ketosteroid isomerase-like protein